MIVTYITENDVECRRVLYHLLIVLLWPIQLDFSPRRHPTVIRACGQVEIPLLHYTSYQNFVSSMQEVALKDKQT